MSDAEKFYQELVSSYAAEDRAVVSCAGRTVGQGLA